MGSDESSIQASDKSSLPLISGQILISVHGSSGSGKTTLINHLVQKPFDSKYNPTKQMESRQILWNSKWKPNETIRIIVWDVIEKTTTSPRPLDTISRADGIVLIYNPDDPYSVEYALSILYKIPIDDSNEKSKIPILILSNFLDLRGNRVKFHPRLVNTPYPQIQISLKTKTGLDVCEKWLDRAYLYNTQRSINARLQSVRKEKEDLGIALRSTIEGNENDLSMKRKKETSNIVRKSSKKTPLPFKSPAHHQTSMPPLSLLLEEKKEEDTSNDKNDNNTNMNKNDEIGDNEKITSNNNEINNDIKEYNEKDDESTENGTNIDNNNNNNSKIEDIHHINANNDDKDTSYNENANIDTDTNISNVITNERINDNIQSDDKPKYDEGKT